MRRILAASTLLAALAVADSADAFCGFYVAPSDAPLYADATMVALMREGTRTALSMSNNYKGPAADSAMVVPVPVVLQKENVKTLPHDVFAKLESLTAPRLVEYWEQDPCAQSKYEESDKKSMKLSASPGAAGGKGKADDYGVTIEAQFTVGEYEIVVLSATESDGLERWLIDSKYNIPKGASAALAPYIKEQMKFFVAKVDIKKVKMDAAGVAVLSPLRVTYESQDFRLPVRLGLVNAPPHGSGAGAKQDLIVWILSKQSRYEVANYPNVFIPTNIDVKNETRKSFGPFYAALFDATMEKHGNKAVITEYAWTSAGCDPCPTPPLQDSDVATLGGDALLGMTTKGPIDAPPPVPKPAPTLQGVPFSKGRPSGMGGFFGGTSHPVVLTRLHTRYDASTLSEDLVFRAADPVAGGREFVVDQTGAIEKGAVKWAANNFQARYAIRHAWTAPITCANPKRGVWGGPHPGIDGPSGPVAATNLAAAPRGELKLASYVVSKVEELDLAKGAPAPAVVPSGNASEPPAFGWFLAGAAGTAAVVGIFALATRKRARRPG